MRLPGLDGYIEGDFRTIPGWMHLQDAVLFDLILHHQLEADISGDLLEIGVYHGKSALVMGYGLREGETLNAADLFGTQDADVSPEGLADYVGLKVDAFVANYQRHHVAPPAIHVGPSHDLKLQPSGFRFTHIDGGHAYEAVAADILLAIECSAPNAIICLDDFRTSHCPGVAAAAWEAAARRSLYPVALSDVKMYAAATTEARSYWLDACRAFGLPWASHDIFGDEVLRIGFSE